ncbi:MAG: BLUF domain-containing protein [Cognatishimia activa]
MEKQSIRRIVFFSTAANDLEREDLLELFDMASRNSTANSLTGLSMYHRRSFCHIREGDPNEITKSLVRMEQSHWHYNLSIVSDTIVERRRFRKWFFAFEGGGEFEDRGPNQILEIHKIFETAELDHAFEDLACRSFAQAFTDDIKAST